MIAWCNQKAMKKKGAGFWNNEYGKKGAHLAISIEPGEDLVKFTRWLEREYKRTYLNPLVSAIDLGCGNGRNIQYLAETYGIRGWGVDISSTAIAQARAHAEDLPLRFSVGSIAEPLTCPDASQNIVLDMMASHFLNKAERKALRAEVARILKPGGWYLLKTFLLDGDLHAERMLRQNPGDEPGTYIHPEIGVAEHVFTEPEIVEELGEDFFVHKVTKSHSHMKNGQAFKRRSMCIYAQRV